MRQRHTSRFPAVLLLALVGHLSLSGCIAYDRRIVIHTTDPSAAEVTAPQSDSHSSPGDAGADVVLATGQLQTGEQSSAGYTLQASRSTGSAIVLRWDTRLPLGNGEQLTCSPARESFGCPTPMRAICS